MDKLWQWLAPSYFPVTTWYVSVPYKLQLSLPVTINYSKHAYGSDYYFGIRKCCTVLCNAVPMAHSKLS